MLWRRSCRPRAGVHTPRAPFSLIRWISEMLNWHYRNLKSTQNVDAFPILVKFITILIVIIQINFINVKKYYICNSFHLAKSRRKHFEIHRNRWNSSSKLWFLPWENYKPRVCCYTVYLCSIRFNRVQRVQQLTCPTHAPDALASCSFTFSYSSAGRG